jgi:flavin-dependent dehydrogenase
MRDVGLELPPQVIQAEIHAYAIYLNHERLRIERPDPSRQIISVYRGGGPRLLMGEPLASFDGFLLSSALALGAELVKARVRSVRRAQEFQLLTRAGVFSADVVVLATGVNSRPPLDHSFRYQPPPTMVMAQDELLKPADWEEDQVSAFFSPPQGLIFGALTPKRDYLNISLLGEDLTVDAVREFLEGQRISHGLQEAPVSLCGCSPRIAIGPARGYYGEGWVAVGDAAVSRLYKDGVGSAFFTSQRLAETLLEKGSSRAAFRRHYAPYCRAVARDNRYGHWLFSLWRLTLRRPRLLAAWRDALVKEKDLPPDRRIHIRILWGMFTGDESYRTLFRLSISPTTVWRLLAAVPKVRPFPRHMHDE